MIAVGSDPLGLVLIVLIALLAVGVVLLSLRVRGLARAQRRAFEGGEVDVIGGLARHARQLADLRDRAEATADQVAALRRELTRALSRLGIVRYDAFDDMGGALSFSAAFLDEVGDGMVITTINGRTDGRTYVKTVRASGPDEDLSEEERAAVAAAMRGGREEAEVVRMQQRRWRTR